VTGFLEEAPGVQSAARLIAVLLTFGCLTLTFAAVVAVFRDGEHAAAVIAALGAPIAALAGGAWGAMRERKISTDEPE
jgi:hypothetical protein